ncbi:MAG: glycosyltransferase family 39 protein [Armatimonadota bacterium]|nr:glycosyltransferase family 39 protein [Armatimonadota bacterium]MDR7422319.1 glycosyltransferase family 39 protein [Armatimonadota bacterium]MDR7453784.1 glycosyltransferase family 39 protein [Armatimonadota bacterium]MDR7455963.1 glycosyltransferase family 39 protein [Armatimonadota bacterium]MDR7496166.1 glycosyltransferase family 39 protein [Armatimonadota bacterium]
MSSNSWRVLAVLAGGVILAAAPLPLVDSDAPLYGRIAANVLASGDWLTLRHPGWLVDKPPLVFWLMAVSFHLGGTSAVTLRLWQLLLVLALAALTGAVARAAGGSREEGWLAALVLLTSAQVFYQATVPQQDVALTASLALVLFALVRYLGDGRRRWAVLAGVAVAAGILVKGIAAAALSAAAAGAVLLVARRVLPHPAGRVVAHAGLAAGVGAILAAPWYLHGVLTHGDPFVRTFLTTGTLGVGRFFRPVISTPPPYWLSVFAYVPQIAVGMLPWTPAFAVGLTGFRRWLREQPAGLGAVGVWLAALFLVFSLSSGDKVFRYIMPCFPAAAVVTARGLGDLCGGARARRAAVAWAAPTLALLVAGLSMLWSSFPTERDRFGPPALAFAAGLAVATAAFGAAAWRGRARAAVALAAVAAMLGYLLFVGAMLRHAPAIDPWPAIVRAVGRDARGQRTVVLYRLGEAFNFAHFYLDAPVALVDGPGPAAAFWLRHPGAVVIAPSSAYDELAGALPSPHAVVFRDARLVVLVRADATPQ